MMDTNKWQPIATAPKDRPILCWCSHEADSYTIDEEGDRLTTYGTHAEGVLSHVKDGPHVLEWGGGYDDSTLEVYCPPVPDWWFLYGSDYETVANPTHWFPIPHLPFSTVDAQLDGPCEEDGCPATVEVLQSEWRRLTAEVAHLSDIVQSDEELLSVIRKLMKGR